MRYLHILLAVLLIMFLFVGCGNSTDGPISETSSTNTISGTTIKEETQQSTIIIVPTTDNTTTQEDATEIINENPFSYKFSHIDDEKTYFYSAPISGMYRFDMGTDNADTNYRLSVYDSINTEIINTDYDTYQHGITHELIKDEIYKIVLSQADGLPKATIKIGIPNKIKNVKGDAFKGKLAYIGQEERFKYIPKITGNYRFDFSTTDVNCNYKFVLKDDINNLIIDTDFNTYTNGVNQYLEADKEYAIKVIQDKGFVDYRIEIHEPREPEYVSGSFSGSVNFIGQNNTYYFTPNTSGKYKIYFSFGDKKGSCKISLFDEKNKEYFTETSEYPNEVDLEEGNTYTLVVSYNDLLMNYDVIIELV